MIFDKDGNMLKPLVNSPEESVKHFTTINEMFGVISEQALVSTKDGYKFFSRSCNLFEILTGNSIQSSSLAKAYQNH